MGCKKCDAQKPKYRKGLWSPEEDQKLSDYVLRHGHGCWSTVPVKAGLQRNGKSCRLRWINYLRPGLKRGVFTAEEEEIVLKLHSMLGNKWSQIALHLPGRTDNEIKNYWNSYLKKKTMKIGEIEAQQNTTLTTQEAQETAPYPQFPNTHFPKFKNFEPLEGSTEIDQSVPQISDRCTPMETHKHPLPKLLFSEWLSVDNKGSPHFMDSGNMAPLASNSNDLNVEGPFHYGFSNGEGSSTGDFGDYGEFNSQFDPLTHLLGGSFFDTLSHDEICSNFNMAMM